MRKVREKEEAGCVVRSLHSAFGAQATKAEWDMRLLDVREHSNSIPELNPNTTKEKYQTAIHEAIAQDMERVHHFISVVSTHDSPLGNALRAYELTERTLDDQAVRVALDRNDIVLLFAVFLAEACIYRISRKRGTKS